LHFITPFPHCTRPKSFCCLLGPHLRAHYRRCGWRGFGASRWASCKKSKRLLRRFLAQIVHRKFRSDLCNKSPPFI
jgi:hypothetical protein